ncbi:hypothetical protein [Acinetobacter radioresistens]|uniref:hypothetical protein n=1 Tax=Acinetobacter radioresistens TaxID=40216 RepID=UPI0012BAAE93|nr:hypothetical protein [Acinetobacter radioresistens]
MVKMKGIKVAGIVDFINFYYFGLLFEHIPLLEDDKAQKDWQFLLSGKRRAGSV